MTSEVAGLLAPFAAYFAKHQGLLLGYPRLPSTPMAKLSQIFAFTVLAAATLTGGVPAKRQTGQIHSGDGEYLLIVFPVLVSCGR